MVTKVKKDTSDLLKELESCSNFKAFYSENEDSILKKNLSELLGELIETKGIKKADAIKRSELSEVYAYQIFSGLRIPERKKLLSLAIGMKLNLAEVQTLLKSSGYAPLYAKNEFDCVIIFGICKELSIIEINTLLYEYGLDTLG